jgi:hypothetical protein
MVTLQEMEGYARRKVVEKGSVKMMKLLQEVSSLTEEIRQVSQCDIVSKVHNVPAGVHNAKVEECTTPCNIRIIEI